MKPLPGPRGALGLAVAGIAVTALLIAGWYHESPAVSVVSLDPLVMAVLPFQPGDGAAPPSLQMGLPEILAVRLSSIPGLTVRTMSEVLALGPPPHDPLQAGRSLGALSVITGDYRQEGRSLRARVRLVDAETGAEVWFREVRASDRELPAFEDEVAREVVEGLMNEGPGSHRAEAPAPAVESSTARFLSLVGGGSLVSLESTRVRESVALLETALRSSPGSVPVNASLSIGCTAMFLSVSYDTAWLIRAEALARRSVWLDPRQAAGYVSLGRVQRLQGRGAESARSLVDALRLDPADGRALRSLGVLLAGGSDVSVVRTIRDRMERLAPGTDPGWLDAKLALREGKAPELIRKLRAEIEAARKSGKSIEWPLNHLGYLSVETSDPAGTLRTVAQMESLGLGSAYAQSLRMRALAQTGDLRGVRRLVDIHRAAYTSLDERALWVAMAWVEAGQRTEALEWVERAVRLGTSDTWSFGEARFDPIRSEPRFKAAAATVAARAEEIQQIARKALAP